MSEIQAVPTDSQVPLGWREALVLMSLFLIAMVFAGLVLLLSSSLFKESISFSTNTFAANDKDFLAQVKALWKSRRVPILLCTSGFLLSLLAFCFYLVWDLWRMASYVGYADYLKIPIILPPLLFFLLLAPPILFVSVLAITAPNIPLKEIPILDYPMQFAENHIMKLFWINLLCWAVILIPFHQRTNSKVSRDSI